MNRKRPAPGINNNNTTNGETKQQIEQQPPKLTVRTKGIVISDMEKFLEMKKLEHAARVEEMQNNADSAERHNCGTNPALPRRFICLMCDILLLARPDIDN